MWANALFEVKVLSICALYNNTCVMDLYTKAGDKWLCRNVTPGNSRRERMNHFLQERLLDD